MTAAQLAGELEVSVRTIYRDIESLQMAGVPLYGDAGHEGGYQLLGGYRLRLTGLTEGEAEALYLSNVPGPVAELGLGQALALAQLKLDASLPSEMSARAQRVRSRFLVDSPGWYMQGEDVPYLRQVADAVWRSRVLEVRYRRWKAPTDVERRLEPYGLVLKAGRWYLVAGPGPRTFRVDQILRLQVRDEGFAVPDDFDLPGYWQRYQREFEARLYRERAVIRLAPDAASRLPGPMASAVAEHGSVDAGGWVRAEVPVESLDHALRAFLALGTDIEVLEPAALRTRMAATARALADRYRT
jgi:predicted DNA-binding transcriptional regulator YafY